MERKRNLLGTFSLVLVGFVFGTMLVTSFGWEKPSGEQVKLGIEQAPVEKVNVDAAKLNNAFVEVSEKVTSSIVLINVVATRKQVPNDMFHNFFFRGDPDTPRQSAGKGSGVIVSRDGYIITNNHVVENATNLTVVLSDKREFKATLVGNDPLTDVAVIKIDGENLPAAYLGNSDNVRVGEWVMAIGNPMSFSSTVTAGIISAKSRNLNIIRGTSSEDRSYAVENFLQTDAAINPGNSGGALVDLSGAVIGINTAIATNGMTGSYIGYGFAIPINLAKAVADQIIEYGEVVRGYIGISLEDVSYTFAKAVGLEKPKGVLIQDVLDDGAAANKDIKAGDIILAVDDVEVNAPNQLQSYVISQRVGTEIRLTIFRSGAEITRSVKLKARDGEVVELREEKPKKSTKKEKGITSKKYEELGLTVKNPSKKELENFKDKSGVLIIDLERFGQAAKQRLFKGLLIVEVNQKKVSSVSEFDELIENSRGKAILVRVVDTSGTSRLIGLDIPKKK